MKYLVEHRTTYEADSAKLQADWPAEYAAFKTDYPDADDRAWVEDCIDAGGFDLLREVDNDWEVWPQPGVREG